MPTEKTETVHMLTVTHSPHSHLFRKKHLEIGKEMGRTVKLSYPKIWTVRAVSDCEGVAPRDNAQGTSYPTNGQGDC